MAASLPLSACQRRADADASFESLLQCELQEEYSNDNPHPDYFMRNESDWDSDVLHDQVHRVSKMFEEQDLEAEEEAGAPISDEIWYPEG
jgi:hypothetical protein